MKNPYRAGAVSIAPAIALMIALAIALGLPPAHAASHREAPLMTLDPAADISDVYAFVSYDAANVAAPLAERKVTLIMNAVPGQEPGSGPNYYAFDDSVRYALHVDHDRDGVDDITYELDHVGDGVGVQELGITPQFPFLPAPYDGRNRRHRDPGEPS